MSGLRIKHKPNNMRGVFLDLETVDRDDLDLQLLEATLPEWSLLKETSDVSKAIGNADIVVTNKICLDRDILHAAGQLKLVCIAATGTNNVDLVAARESNITVCNVRAYATASVVEHVFTLMLNLVRNLRKYHDAVDRGAWQNADGFCLLDYPVRELNGQTLGIIGYGELGKAVATVARAFGMQILVAQRAGTPADPERVPLDKLLSESNIISVHCPLTDSTRNLIGRRELALMRKDSILINTARGGIVNETALSEALRNGEIAGAGIDVLSEEPPRDGNPLLDPSLPNLILTPHIAWAGISARQALINEIAANIRAFLAGTPRNVVQPG
jgi:glycerate dehydrogenase